MNGPWEQSWRLDAKRNQEGTGGMVCTAEEKTKKKGMLRLLTESSAVTSRMERSDSGL